MRCAGRAPTADATPALRCAHKIHTRLTLLGWLGEPLLGRVELQMAFAPREAIVEYMVANSN